MLWVCKVICEVCGGGGGEPDGAVLGWPDCGVGRGSAGAVSDSVSGVVSGKGSWSRRSGIVGGDDSIIAQVWKT
jgi:hypothetical protein